MATNSLRWLAVNDDATAELYYWKDQLLLSVWLAAGFVVATVAAIGFWPPDSGNPELRAFVREFWSLFVECALWLGFLCGLLWGAAKRIGCGLAGSLPWQPLHQLTRQAVIARYFGQAAASFAIAAAFLWVVQQLGVMADAGTAMMFARLAPLASACLGFAGLCAMAAIIGRGSPSPSETVE